MKILVINGPNINMLGSRDPEKYGKFTLKDIENFLKKESKKLNVTLTFFQSNHEGDIVDVIQKAKDFHGIIINAGAYTHTSIAIRDALEIFNKPVVEVHLSNVYNRETFRQKSLLSDVVIGVVAGFKEYSYIMALYALHNLLKNQ